MKKKILFVSFWTWYHDIMTNVEILLMLIVSSLTWWIKIFILFLTHLYDSGTVSGDGIPYKFKMTEMAKRKKVKLRYLIKPVKRGVCRQSLLGLTEKGQQDKPENLQGFWFKINVTLNMKRDGWCNDGDEVWTLSCYLLKCS